MRDARSLLLKSCIDERLRIWSDLEHGKGCESPTLIPTKPPTRNARALVSQRACKSRTTDTRTPAGSRRAGDAQMRTPSPETHGRFPSTASVEHEAGKDAS
jgi:hypothetical protein